MILYPVRSFLTAYKLVIAAEKLELALCTEGQPETNRVAREERHNEPSSKRTY